METQIQPNNYKNNGHYITLALSIVAAFVIVGGIGFGLYGLVKSSVTPTDELTKTEIASTVESEESPDVIDDTEIIDEDDNEDEDDADADEGGAVSEEDLGAGSLSGDTSSVTYPDWVEKLNYKQGTSNEDYKNYGTHHAGGLIAVTTAIKILKNNQSLTPKDVYNKVKSNVRGSVMSGSDGLYWWALRSNAPKLYGLNSGKLFYDNLDASKISSMKSRLQKGHMIIANSAKGYFLKSTGGSTKYRTNHTLMFYKYKNNKYWAKDSAESAASIGYTEKDLYKLFRDGTTNSVWWVSKASSSTSIGGGSIDSGSVAKSGFPEWVEKLKYTQGSHAQDKKTYGIEQACGVIAMTTAIKILKNDQKLTPNQVAKRIKNEVKGSIMPNSGGSPYWWAIRSNAPRLYGLTSGKLFYDNLNSSKINSMKTHLQKGHMIVAHSQKGYFLKKTGGKTKYHGSHTIMFYKFQNNKYWAKDSAGGDASIGYTVSDLYKLFRNGTTNSVWWVSKK